MRTVQKRLFYLDVIRVAAAVLIVIYHFPLSIWVNVGSEHSVDILHAAANGSWGMIPVYGFFMVSGAALMHRYGNEGKLDIRKFYKKRFLSIYPLFWIAYVIGFFAVYWQLGHLYDVPAWSIIWSVIGIDGWIVNWVPTFYMVGEWFLGSIIMLYLVFPLVRFFWKKNPNRTMLAVSLAAAVLFWYHPFPMDIKQNPVIDLFYFLLGAWLEELRRRMEERAVQKNAKASGRRTRAEKTGFGIWLISLLALGIWVFVPVTRGLPPMEATVSAGAWGAGMFLRQCFILAGTCAFYIVLMGISRLLEAGRHSKKIILEISGKTYGIFLTHHMAAQLLCGHFDGAASGRLEILCMLILVFLVTWIAALAIYRIQAYIKERF